ncbi:MAG: FAD-dependent oxidoreductase, partial [Rhodospirillaceae bacterium]|nr:FAD-dependent oxidoreductase [Rhodospirillaceae bacterium]
MLCQVWRGSRTRFAGAQGAAIVHGRSTLPTAGEVRMNERFDVVVVGAGHNGLVCAYYLARAGLRVCVLERSDAVGGAAVSESFHPGFR